MKIFQIVHSTINQTMMIPRLLSEVIISDHPDFFIFHTFQKDKRAKPVLVSLTFSFPLPFCSFLRPSPPWLQRVK